MNLRSRLFFLSTAAVAVLLAGCSNPGQSYVARHPELTPGQRKVMQTGKPEAGTDVAGLSREQIHLAMGDPAQQTKIDGKDAWIYTREKSEAVPLDANSGQHGSLRGSSESPANLSEPEWTDSTIRTTIYFESGKAVRAEVVEEKKAT